jgi:hypothetical protein
MKFTIHRTSTWCSNEPPCEEAIMVKTENQRLNYAEKYRIHYEIEINTLEELFEFSKKHGKLVFIAEASEELPYIEIYDDGRE